MTATAPARGARVAAKPRKKAPLVMPPSEFRAAALTSAVPTTFVGQPKQQLKRRNSAPGGAPSAGPRLQRVLPRPAEAALQRPARGPNKRTYGGKRTTTRLVRRSSSAPGLDIRPQTVAEEQEEDYGAASDAMEDGAEGPSSADALPPPTANRLSEAGVRLQRLRDHFAAVDTTRFREEKPVKWMTLDTTTPTAITVQPEATPEDRSSLIREKFPSLAVAFDEVSVGPAYLLPLLPAPFASGALRFVPHPVHSPVPALMVT